MAKITLAPKQPSEVQDYDLYFGDRIPEGDTIVSATIVCTPAMSPPPSYAISDQTVKIWIYAGVSGLTYKITVLATTQAGRVVETDAISKVKEV